MGPRISPALVCRGIWLPIIRNLVSLVLNYFSYNLFSELEKLTIFIFSSGPRQQMNFNTGFIDASMIYGSTMDTLKQVRAFGQKGAMASTKLSDGRKMLPLANVEGCSAETVPSEVPRCHFGAGILYST